MQIAKLEHMVNGWYVGDFAPAVFRTTTFEVCHKTHKKDEVWPAHYHAVATEINLLISGKMLINNIELNAGDIFTIYPKEVAVPVFLEDCILTVIKVPSIIGDKFEV
jgi:mannose-6-phosphate isomerase-like protein (cupin superfamily)